MFSTLKKLFGARAVTAVDSRSQLRPVAPAPSVTPQRPVRAEAPARPIVPPANTPANLTLPLRAVLDRLPPDLMVRVRQMDVGSAEVSIPMAKVLSQIGSGSVKISFGELRQGSPGVFTSENDRDRSLVEIPLHEVLSRLNPALLSRRPAQKQVSIPAEVTGPFGGQSQVTFSTVPIKTAAPAAPVEAPVAPIVPLKPAVLAPSTLSSQPALRIQQPAISFQPAAPAAPMRPAAPAPASPAMTYRPASPAPTARPASPVAPAALHSELEQTFFRKASPQPVAPSQPSQPVYTPIAITPTPAPASAPIHMPEPPRNVAPSAPITPIAPEIESEPEPIRFSVPPPAPVAPSIGSETKFLTVPIADLAPFWPEAVQHEIVQHQMSMSAVGLPFGMIEIAIKQGKVALPWKVLRSWIKPPVFLASSTNDALLLELSLKVITPLFLAELRTSKTQRKVQVDATIPDLFSSRLQPDAPAAEPAIVATPAPAPARVAPPAPTPTDTNYFIRKASEDQPEEIAPVVKKGPTPGTAFLARYATPNEIIAKAAALKGVDGALIALPDGLLVASHIPPTMNADTIAAFLPQIFSRVTQCTKELRLGDLNNLNFTVGTTPWKIFKVGAIYFAVFGRAGEPLPTAQLAGIAAELDRKAK